MTAPQLDDAVFLNVPYDGRYEPLLRSLVYTVHDCGLLARSALEIEDGGQARLEKICGLIRRSRYGVHDLSRTGIDKVSRLPRFNMPLELGIFLGAMKLGPPEQRTKACLILDQDPHRYRRLCSDLAGYDVRAHGQRADSLIRGVRDWLSNQLVGRGVQVPGPSRMVARFHRFREQLPGLCARVRLDARELTFNEYRKLVAGWLQLNPW
jgi:hypothetical protein